MKTATSEQLNNPFGIIDTVSHIICEELYQFTFYGCISQSSNYTLHFWIRSETNQQLSVQLGNEETDIEITPTWKEITLHNYVDATEYDSFCFNMNNNNIYLYNIKLESGDLATDWTPAQEDIEKAISTLQTNFNIANGKLSSVISENTSTKTSLDELKKYTNSNINDIKTDIDKVKINLETSSIKLTSLEQNINGFKTTVSETYSTKTQVASDINETKSYADSVGTNTLNSAKADATSKANAAENNAKTDTTTKLQNYSTTSQMFSAISASKSEILESVSNNYTSNSDVELANRGINKWVVETYSDKTITGDSIATIELIKGKTPTQIFEFTDESVSAEMSLGDYYIGHGKTNIYCKETKDLIVNLITNDSGALYLNGILLGNTTSSVIKSFTIPFKKGWNVIEVVYCDEDGEDGFKFDTILSSWDNCEVMNCYASFTNSSTASIKVISDEIDSKVSRNGIVSAINQTPETITIDANKINLNGYVTINDLNTSGSTVINGDNITTGSIKSANYNEVDGIGSKLNLLDGSFDSKNLHWDSTGVFSCVRGYVGGWQIGDKTLSSSNIDLDSNEGRIRTHLTKTVNVDSNNPIYIGMNTELYNGELTSYYSQTGKVGTPLYENTTSISQGITLERKESLNEEIKAEYSTSLTAFRLTTYDVDLKGMSEGSEITFYYPGELNPSSILSESSKGVLKVSNNFKVGNVLDVDGNIYIGTNKTLYGHDAENIGRTLCNLTVSDGANTYNFGTGGCANKMNVGSGSTTEMLIKAQYVNLCGSKYDGCNVVHNGSNFYPAVTAKVNLGTNSYRWTNCYVMGGYYANASTVISSDKRIKTADGINKDGEIVEAKDFIMNLKPIAFKYNTDYNTSDRTHYGFYAQEVKETLDNLNVDRAVFCSVPTVEKDLKDCTEDEVIYSLRYEEMIAPLVKVVQEQQKQIEELTNIVEELRNKEEVSWITIE